MATDELTRIFSQASVGYAVAQALLPNAAYFLPELRTRRKWWGGPPGPRGTPASRRRHNDIGILHGTMWPTGASAAVQGDRPTSGAVCSLLGKVTHAATL